MADISNEGEAERVLEAVRKELLEVSGRYRPGKDDSELEHLVDRGKIAISTLALLQREGAVLKLVEIVKDADGAFVPELRIAAMDAAAGILRGRRGAVSAEHAEAFYVQLRFLELEACEILARKASANLASIRRIGELKDVIGKADQKLASNQLFVACSRIGGLLSKMRNGGLQSAPAGKPAILGH